MPGVAHVRERYFSFVSMVARRLQKLGRDPADALIISPESFGLAAVTTPGTPVMFAMHVWTPLQQGVAIEEVADRFVHGWLRQIAIDDASHPGTRVRARTHKFRGAGAAS
jgi:hypothetical protein